MGRSVSGVTIVVDQSHHLYPAYQAVALTSSVWIRNQGYATAHLNTGDPKVKLGHDTELVDGMSWEWFLRYMGKEVEFNIPNGPAGTQPERTPRYDLFIIDASHGTWVFHYQYWRQDRTIHWQRIVA